MRLSDLKTHEEVCEKFGIQVRPDIEKITERANAATEGPWHWNSYNAVASGPMTQKNYRLVQVPHEAAGEPWTTNGDYPEPWKSLDWEYEPIVCHVPPSYGDTATGRHAADADFIAHARQDVPSLCAYIVQLEQLFDDGWDHHLRDLDRIKALEAQIEAAKDVMRRARHSAGCLSRDDGVSSDPAWPCRCGLVSARNTYNGVS